MFARMCLGARISVTLSDLTKNDRDLKFGTHTPNKNMRKTFFLQKFELETCYPRKNVASCEFPHVSSIA